MTSRERIRAAAAFQPVDRGPFDFFDEAGDLFVQGRYHPAERLKLTYTQQVEARVRFHRRFQTDLIFDTPVLIPTRVPYCVTLTYEGRPIVAPDLVFSSISALAWNAMPPAVLGPGRLPESARGTVVKTVEWADGCRATEALDLDTGTTDALGKPFASPADLLVHLDNLAGNLAHADYSYARHLRAAVGPEVMLSATLVDPFSVIGWYLGNEAMLYLLYDDPPNLARISEALLAIAVDTGLDMRRHDIDLFRIGAATSCLLSPDLYRRFCLPYQQRLVRALQDAGGLVHLHLCGHVRHLLPVLGRTGAAILETITPPPLGDTTLAEAKQALGGRMCLKGNMSPTGVLRHGTPAQCAQEAAEILYAGSSGGGFIFSVADNLAPGTPEANVAAVAQVLQQQSS